MIYRQAFHTSSTTILNCSNKYQASATNINIFLFHISVSGKLVFSIEQEDHSVLESEESVSICVTLEKGEPFFGPVLVLTTESITANESERAWNIVCMLCNTSCM